jgi:DNA-binding PadR family transcriptional regulator
MSFPKNQSEQLVIVSLGKSGKFLSGKQMHEYAGMHKICSEKELLSVQAFYDAINRLDKSGLIKKNSTSKKRNFDEQLWELTPEGEKVYENISNVYSIIDYVPNWYEINTHCLQCKDGKEKCFEDYRVDLENVLKNNYKINKKISNWEIKELFTSPKNIQEFIFWTIMYKESKKQLEKFGNHLERLNIILE